VTTPVQAIEKLY